MKKETSAAHMNKTGKSSNALRIVVAILIVVLIVGVIGGIIYLIINGGKSEQKTPAPTEHETFVISTQLPSETLDIERKLKVGIVQHSLGKPSKDCYEGFITELNNRGLLNYTEIVYIVDDNDEKCREKIKGLIDGGCDLIYTIGRFSSEVAAEYTKDIPVVFGGVNSPAEIGLVKSNEAPGGNVTGVSSFTPCFDQIDLIPVLLPKVKTVASIYSGTDENTASQGIVASKEAENIGLKCDQYPVDSEEALTDALSKIKEAKTEVIYIPSDKFLRSKIDIINKFSYENKIPVICGDQATLERGAFATSEVNYNSIGHRAAELAHSILFEKNSPATISVVYKHDCNNIVNKEVMETLGIKLSQDALSKVQLWTEEAQ